MERRMRRTELASQVSDLVDPLVSRFSAGRARVRLGVNTAIHDDTAAELEAFARPLWGLAPLAAGGQAVPHAELWVRGLANGSDPAHPEYWGEPVDHDQRIVEMAAIGFALALAPEQWWDPLSGRRTRPARPLAAQRAAPADHRQQLALLPGAGQPRPRPGGGAAHDRSLITARLDRLENFWLGDGWYADGPTERRDYYVPWAMHFYGLLYDTPRPGGDRFEDRAARVRRRLQPLVRRRRRRRAVRPQPHLPLRAGRVSGARCRSRASTCCRGARSKGYLLRHLRWWRGRPVTGPDGLLSIGYGYPQPALAEQYNAPGSPYWSLKAFLPLALPEQHAFWTAKEEPAPALPAVSAQPHAGAVLMRDARRRHPARRAPAPPVGAPRRREVRQVRLLDPLRLQPAERHARARTGRVRLDAGAERRRRGALPGARGAGRVTTSPPTRSSAPGTRGPTWRSPPG